MFRAFRGHTQHGRFPCATCPARKPPSQGRPCRSAAPGTSERKGRAPMRVYYDRDADINLVKGKKVAIVGYGSQGHAHALNLRDSGVKDVAVGLPAGPAPANKAARGNLPVISVAQAARLAAVTMMLTTEQPQG